MPKSVSSGIFLYTILFAFTTLKKQHAMLSGRKYVAMSPQPVCVTQTVVYGRTTLVRPYDILTVLHKVWVNPRVQDGFFWPHFFRYWYPPEPVLLPFSPCMKSSFANVCWVGPAPLSDASKLYRLEVLIDM